MKIWITGIAGFLGSHLAESLIAEGQEVYGNDSLICGDANNISRSMWTRMECSSFNLMKGAFEKFKPDVVVHCAATAHEGLSNFSPSFITKNIYEASVSTFSAAIASGVKRIVYMSSMSRYGVGRCDDPNGGLRSNDGYDYDLEFSPAPPFLEDWHHIAPVDPYGVAKVASEETLKILCDLHDVKWSILVPHNIIGPRQRSVDPYRNVAAIMINRCKLGKPPIVYGDGMQKRCFSPIQDCLPSIIRAVHGDADGQVVNIGPDKGEITVKDLAYKIISLTGFDGHPVYMEDRPNEVKNAYCSSEKARRLLGYEEKQSIDDCLKEMVDYIKPALFVYDFPIEILTEKTPKTWSEGLM